MLKVETGYLQGGEIMTVWLCVGESWKNRVGQDQAPPENSSTGTVPTQEETQTQEIQGYKLNCFKGGGEMGMTGTVLPKFALK